MRRLAVLPAALAATAAMALGVSTAGAVSPSQQECEAAGGQFQRVNGQTQCVTVQEGKNSNFTQETTTTGQGNTSNKQQQDTTCSGTGSGKCPPGQF